MKRVLVAALLLAGCAPAFQVQRPEFNSKFTRKFAEVDGFRLHYDVVGKGSPVLFLHGFSSFLNAWDDTAKALADGHRSILVDLPGHGFSDRTDVDYSPNGVAKRVLGLLDALGEKRVSIVAHSWGASVALALALLAPDRVDKLVIVDGWMYSEQANLFMRWSQVPAVGEGLWNWFYDQNIELRYAMAFHEPEKWIDEAVVDGMKRIMALPGSKAAALAVIRSLDQLPDQETRYGEVRAPSLLIWCREDRVSDVGAGETLMNQIPASRLEVIPNCGHMPMIEQATRFQALLRGFL